MQSRSIVSRIIAESGMTKSALSAASGVSRALIDDYLKGKTQPSAAQLERIADAAGFRIDFSLSMKARELPTEFLAVLEFGDLFPRKSKDEMVNLGPVWRNASRIAHG